MRGYANCGKALVLALAFGVYAAFVSAPAAAPEAAIRNPAYVTDHAIVPPSIMGIRG